MSKAYSNKALPAGTVLREWRLEQVLGVGGFGIVYKGRGIYFDELVAIKEYFPSSISERDEDATVVPIDSDAEEVHALGLKKFVEEAKLLWNLSTPTRHPNIVSVRSLFEIHGTAYMVMDFEDGGSLSALLKKKTKFNEQSLSNIILPIAEGLERAHRVGVLHRDIKPPNIIVNDDGRSVLIDFGSARFESGDATSTKVTFHTPPYAAIEQYVRTYEQGPWTDIYALGVVMYECITGEKPPEVLERMHGGASKPLAEGDWPGFSKTFLSAVDAAMTIRPDERPQSISAWLKLFDRKSAPAAPPPEIEDGTDDDRTRIATWDTASEKIKPVAPVESGFSSKDQIDTGVPETPSKAEFKKPRPRKVQALEGVSAAEAEAAAAAAPLAETETPKAEAPKADAPKADAAPAKADKPTKAPAKDKTKSASDGTAGSLSKLPKPAIYGGAAAAVIVVAGLGWALFGGGGGTEVDKGLLEEGAPVAVEPVDISGAEQLAPALESLAGDAQKAGAPAAAVTILTDAGNRIKQELSQVAANDSTAAKTKTDELYVLATDSANRFTQALLTDVSSRAGRLARDVRWANPDNPGAARSEPANRQSIARNVRTALGGLRTTAQTTADAKEPGAAMSGARQALAQLAAFNTASRAAYRANSVKTPTESNSAASSAAAPQAAAAAQEQPQVQEAPSSGSSSTGVSPAKMRSFNSAVSSARNVARDVIKLGGRNKPGSNASDAEKEGYRIRQANADAARNYQKYLDTLESAMRGVTDDNEASNQIIKANQTESYLKDLLRRSNATLN